MELGLKPTDWCVCLFSGIWGFSLLCYCFLKKDLEISIIQLWEIGDLSGSEYSFVEQIMFSEWLLHAILLGSGDTKMYKTWLSAILVGNAGRVDNYNVMW